MTRFAKTPALLVSLIFIGVVSYTFLRNSLGPAEGVTSQSRDSEKKIESISSIAISNLPLELHAKSALRISAPKNLVASLEAGAQTFSIPLSNTKRIELAVSKVIQKNGDRTMVFGALANGEKSHYLFVWDKGKLSSGNLSVSASQEHYRVSTLESGEVILSLTDPEIETPTCGCEDCLKIKS